MEYSPLNKRVSIHLLLKLMFQTSTLLQFQYGRSIKPKWNEIAKWINCSYNSPCSSRLFNGVKYSDYKQVQYKQRCHLYVDFINFHTLTCDSRLWNGKAFYLCDPFFSICGGLLCVWHSKWGDLQAWVACLGGMLCRLYVLWFLCCSQILIITFNKTWR